jgi:hypothetical protein
MLAQIYLIDRPEAIGDEKTIGYHLNEMGGM